MYITLYTDSVLRYHSMGVFCLQGDKLCLVAWIKIWSSWSLMEKLMEEMVVVFCVFYHALFVGYIKELYSCRIDTFHDKVVVWKKESAKNAVIHNFPIMCCSSAWIEFHNVIFWFILFCVFVCLWLQLERITNTCIVLCMMIFQKTFKWIGSHFL